MRLWPKDNKGRTARKLGYNLPRILVGRFWSPNRFTVTWSHSRFVWNRHYERES